MHRHGLDKNDLTITVESPNGTSRKIHPNITMSPYPRSAAHVVNEINEKRKESINDSRYSYVPSSSSSSSSSSVSHSRVAFDIPSSTSSSNHFSRNHQVGLSNASTMNSLPSSYNPSAVPAYLNSSSKTNVDHHDHHDHRHHNDPIPDHVYQHLQHSPTSLLNGFA